MIGKSAARDYRSGRQVKPQIYQGIGRGQNKGSYDGKVIRIDIGQIVKTGDSIGKMEVDLGMNKIIGEENLEVMQGHIKTLKGKAVEESIGIITEMKVMAEVEIGTGLEKGHFLETLAVTETIGAQAIVGPDQDQGQV